MQKLDYELLTALGTVGAVVLALLVAITQAAVALFVYFSRRRRARWKVASLVSAWIEHKYSPSPEGNYYRRSVTLHISNESDEPVYRLQVLCGIETESGIIQAGPLAAPSTIPALPPKREFTYDITAGMLSFGEFAHDAFHGLVAEISFRDHENVRWERTFAGDLTRPKKPSAQAPTDSDDELILAQAGPVDNPYNPHQTILIFAEYANSDEVDDDRFFNLLKEEAGGWASLAEEEVKSVRAIFRDANVAAHIWYPAPRIAYVRLLLDPPDSDGGSFVHVATLVWRRDRAWTLFGLGPYQPWTIGFEKGELDLDPLDEREAPT